MIVPAIIVGVCVLAVFMWLFLINWINLLLLCWEPDKYSPPKNWWSLAKPK